jgi:hypothetical protein
MCYNPRVSFEPGNSDGLRRELETARASLNHHLQEKLRHEEEVNRYQLVVDGLEATIMLIENPASAARKRQPKMPEQTGEKKKRIRWRLQWPIILTELATKNVVPTKGQLMREIQARFALKDAAANHAVNMAVNRGEIHLRNDKCYLDAAKSIQTGAN